MQTSFADLSGWDVHDAQARQTVRDGKQVLQLAGAAPVLYGARSFTPPFRLACTVAFDRQEGFAGCVFGAQGAADYDVVYIYPTGDSGEVQYDSSMHGSMTWQLFHDARYRVPAPVAPGDWLPLKVDLYAEHAEVTVGEASAPQLIIDAYLQGAEGHVGLWGYRPVFIHTFAVTPLSASPAPNRRQPRLPAGLLTDWEVRPASGATPPAGETGTPPPDAGGWQRVGVEENGALNLNRLYPVAREQVDVRTRLYSEREAATVLRVGYSDELRLWLNGKEIHAGSWVWDPPKADGRVRLAHAAVTVRLQRGWNAIAGRLSHREPPFGWGLIMALAE